MKTKASRRRLPKKPLFVGMAVGPAHHSFGAPGYAEGVVAAIVICPHGRLDTDSFYDFVTNEEGSANVVSERFVRWLSRHTQNPVCVVIDSGKFHLAKAALGLHFSSNGMKVLDLASMAGATCLDLEMLVKAVNATNHAVIGTDESHLCAKKEVNIIVSELKRLFPHMLPLSLRRQRRQVPVTG